MSNIFGQPTYDHHFLEPFFLSPLERKEYIHLKRKKKILSLRVFGLLSLSLLLFLQRFGRYVL